jgi:demethylmenaquinone methyltransferase/2-methoxy-6-polyprenyl-1,4-benzoquinol methylase/phosphoethanolamine N-methyltransferase
MTAKQEHAKPSPHTTGRLIRWAHWYNLIFGRKPTRVHTRAIRAADPRPGEKALDVGCGPGTIALVLASKVAPGGSVVGIDASPEMISVARKKARSGHSDARFEAAAIEGLPFPDDSFDLATSTFMMHHLPEDVQRKGIAEVRRVLKPGGRFVIADFSSESQSFLGHLLSIIGHGHGQSTFPSLVESLRGAGFVNVEQVDSTRKGTMIVRAS